MSANRLRGTLAEQFSFGSVRRQLYQHRRKLCWFHYLYGVVCPERLHDVAKIVGIRTNHNRNAVLCRLQNVVTATRHQAAPNKRYIRQRIDGGQLPQAIEQKHSAAKDFSKPDSPVNPDRR